MRIFGKIGRRLLGWFLLAALIPLLFMGYQGYYFAREALQREVFLHMEAIAESKRLAIEQWFRERRDDLQVLTTNPQLVGSIRDYLQTNNSARFDEISRVLRDYQAQSLSYAFMCLHDMEGNALACTMAGKDFQTADFSHSALFEDALKSNEPVLSGIYLQRGIGPGMHVAAAIRSAGGKPLGVLVATLALAHTLDPIILDTTGLGQTGQAYLVDESKVMLTPSRFMNHPAPLTHTMDSEGIRHALIGRGGTGVYQGFEGKDVLGAWAYLPDQRWALIAEMNAEEAFAPLARLRRNALIVAILTFGAVTLIVGFVSRSISRPIHELALASLDVSKGNLDRAVVVRMRDELGQLAERFNEMVRSLRDSRQSLQVAYDEIVQAQERVVQAERLAAVGELVAGVVHEIRNPLSSVKMNLRILESKCAGDAVAKEHFALAKAQTERLETMLADLLDYSKPVTLSKSPIRITDLVNEALALFNAENQDRQIVIDTRIEEDMPTVPMDRPRIIQVLLNLLLNAKQAMNSGGTLGISARQSPQSNVIEISVSDSGTGISAENLKHIFEPFFTTRKNGTGLGLSNARKIIEIHGGALRIESEPGHGTIARITLPMGS